jgi:hypothetical protein
MYHKCYAMWTFCHLLFPIFHLQFNLQENYKKSATASVYKLPQQMSKNVTHKACNYYVVTDSQMAQDFQQWTYMIKLLSTDIQQMIRKL